MNRLRQRGVEGRLPNVVRIVVSVKSAMVAPALSALYDACVAAPASDAPRIAFAAALDARGDAWGAFVQTQLKLTAALRANDDNKALELEAAANAQGRGHAREWANGLAEIASVVEFSRGLVESIVIDAATFVAHADEIFQRAPIRYVVLKDVGDHLAAVLGLPHLAQLVWLSFGGDRTHPIGDSGMQKLAACGSLENLRVLDITFQSVTRRGLEALCASPVLRSLVCVELAGNEFSSPIEEIDTDWASGRDVAESLRLPELGQELEAKYGPLAWLHPVTRLAHRPPRFEEL